MASVKMARSRGSMASGKVVNGGGLKNGLQLRCFVPAPYGYKCPFKWPMSRDYMWCANVPHKELMVEKAVQNWIRLEGDQFKFPGGGTMFPNGVDIGELINLKDGSIRTAIDTG